MKSGLEDRNNARGPALPDCRDRVSMKSGLEDRNNKWDTSPPFKGYTMSQ